MIDIGRQIIDNLNNLSSAMSAIDKSYNKVWKSFIELPTIIKYSNEQDNNKFKLITDDNRTAKIIQKIDNTDSSYYFHDIDTFLIEIDGKDYYYFENGYSILKNNKLPKIVDCIEKPDVNLYNIPIHFHEYNEPAPINEYKEEFSKKLNYGIHYLIPSTVDKEDFKDYIHDIITQFDNDPTIIADPFPTNDKVYPLDDKNP